jgi:hypothetical protein
MPSVQSVAAGKKSHWLLWDTRARAQRARVYQELEWE